mmetsp:Transcript_28394/g.90372  ORF Transcript_28394/g.90372 Transcript_28394/m.90372 type:complete len:579 (-) Transcript_28394:134-1870(-)
MAAAFAAAVTLRRSATKFTELPRNIDPKLWAANVVDLHRVLRVVNGLYLVLEHNNEALLRVATEIVTDKKARKVINWQEATWYEDDEKREWFRFVVKRKLELVLKEVTSDRVSGAQDTSGASGGTTDNHKEQLELLQAALAKEKELTRQAEARVREALADNQEAEARADSLLARSVRAEAGEQEARARAETAEASVQAAEAHAMRSEAAVQAAEASLQAAEARAMRSEAAVQAAEAGLQGLQARARASGASAREATCEESRAMADGGQQSTAASEARLAKMQEEEARLRRLLDETTVRVKELQHSLASKDAEATELCEKLAASDRDVKQHRVLLEEMHAKLKDVVHRSQQHGMSAVLGRIIEESGLGAAIRATSVWERLYSDAQKRMARWQQAQEGCIAASRAVFQPNTNVLAELQNSDLPRQLAPLLADTGSTVMPTDHFIEEEKGRRPGQRVASGSPTGRMASSGSPSHVPIRQLGLELIPVKLARAQHRGPDACGPLTPADGVLRERALALPTGTVEQSPQPRIMEAVRPAPIRRVLLVPGDLGPGWQRRLQESSSLPVLQRAGGRIEPEAQRWR